jgi:hypothetical protein
MEPSVESLLESPIAELSLDSNFSTKLSFSIPRDQEKYEVHQAKLLYLVRLDTSGSLPGIPEGPVSDRVTHCHLSHRHGTHTEGLGVVFKDVIL